MRCRLLCSFGSNLEFILFVSLFSANLFNSSLSIIGTFLKVSEALNFTLFFFLCAKLVTNLILFTLIPFPIVLCNLVIKTFLGRASRHLLFLRIFIRNANLFVHDFNLDLLGGNSRSIFQLDLLNVCK